MRKLGFEWPWKTKKKSFFCWDQTWPTDHYVLQSFWNFSTKKVYINLSKILLTFMFSWNNPSIQIKSGQPNSDSPPEDQSALIMIHYDQQFMIEKRRFRNPSLLSDGSISRPCIFSVSQNLLRQCIASVSQKIFCRDLWNVKLDGVPQRPPPHGWPIWAFRLSN